MNGAYPDDEINLKEIWNLLLRNWLLITATTGIVAGGTLVYALRAVPVWESVTSIRIDEDQTNLPVLDILSSLSGGSEVQTEMEVLRSRTLVEEVVDSLRLQIRLVRPRGVARAVVLSDLSVRRDTPVGTYVLSPRGDGTFEILDEETGGSLGMASTGETARIPGATFRINRGLEEDQEIQISVVEFDKAVAAFQGAVTVARPNREAGIVTVRYQSADTVLVHQVPNRLAASFIRNRQRVQRTGATSTVIFLEEQIDTLAGQLREAENNLVQFREEAGVVSIEAEATAQVTQLVRIQADRMVVNAERAALQALMDDVEREAAVADPDEPSPYRRLISFPSLLGNQAASELLRILNEIENRRSELLQRRTMEDPDVLNLTGRIHEIEHQLEVIGTTYLQGLGDQVVALDQTLERFRVDLEKIPEKEIQFVRLTRQAEILSGLFTLLQTRLQEVRIAKR
jgi:tyrosine-protein kinase Etk/Wzc